MEARRQGKALPLKDFHNDIKRKMINRSVLLPPFRVSSSPSVVFRNPVAQAMLICVGLHGRLTGFWIWPVAEVETSTSGQKQE